MHEAGTETKTRQPKTDIYQASEKLEALSIPKKPEIAKDILECGKMTGGGLQKKNYSSRWWKDQGNDSFAYLVSLLTFAYWTAVIIALSSHFVISQV
ncbi:hypothetical protein CEXT_545441 [Caerostris extrusa]|uniref:Uncharacterized protein n=1 Tax=Caerostris extrusa TaxID=172846 RepID=A0AAV4QKU3_CAEEX|nr:hypothetical protein CEXT_545441 [Caerostris extrusa]